MARTSESTQDEYIGNLLKNYNFPEADTAKHNSDLLHKSAISISLPEAQILSVFLRGRNIKKAVEVGTLTGFSALFILKSMERGGTLWTLEKDPIHAEKAQSVLVDYAQKQEKSVQLLLGDAEENLPELSNQGPFDAVFIDGNKGAYGTYLQWAEENLRQGGVIIADNVFLRGGVYGIPNQTFSDKQILVVKEFNQRLARPDLFETCIIPTAEGMAIAIKK